MAGLFFHATGASWEIRRWSHFRTNPSMERSGAVGRAPPTRGGLVQIGHLPTEAGPMTPQARTTGRDCARRRGHPPRLSMSTRARSPATAPRNAFLTGVGRLCLGRDHQQQASTTFLGSRRPLSIELWPPYTLKIPAFLIATRNGFTYARPICDIEFGHSRNGDLRRLNFEHPRIPRGQVAMRSSREAYGKTQRNELRVQQDRRGGVLRAGDKTCTGSSSMYGWVRAHLGLVPGHVDSERSDAFVSDWARALVLCVRAVSVLNVKRNHARAQSVRAVSPNGCRSGAGIPVW